LCELKTDDAVRERIGQLPAKLEDLYLELYEKFAKYPADADRQITRNALSWLLCGQRRLNSTEFLAALSMSPRRRFGQVTKNQVLDMCCNLVVFDSTLDTFRFAHLSVREFLEKQPDYSSTTANSLVAETCLSALVCFSYNLATERFLSQHRRPSIKEATFSNDLAAYTTIYWATHCQLAADQRTQGALKDLFLSFLSNESAIATWAARLQESPERYTIDYSLYRQFKKLEDTKATSAIALFLACSFDFPEVFADQAAKGSFRADFVNSNGRTAFQVAVRHNSYKVVSIFISDKLTQITKEVVKEAAGSWDGGKDTMMLLLERRGADIQITKEVVIAAARNWNSGKEVITLLLEQREAEVQITEEVVIAAAENWNSGKEVITLLLKQREAEVQITEEVVKAAARNSRSEVMALLLDQRGNEVKITDEVVKAAAEDGCSDVMALLLDQRGDDIKITDEVVKAAARNWSGEVIALLLDRRGDDVKITDEVVKAAARNSRSEVMTLLLDQRGDDVKITDEVVKAAARNSCSEVMTLLLDRRGDNIKITDEVVKAAAGAWSGEVMTLLLDRRGGDVKITDKVVKAVAGNEHSGKEIMAVLLDRRGDDVKITDKVVKAVAGNEESGEEIMTLLLDRRGDNVKITDDIVTAAATSGQERVLRLIDTRLKILSFKEKWFSIARFYNAAQDGDEEMIRGLLVLGIEPDLKNPRNVSPLWRAACCGHFAVVKLLLDTQAVDINVRSIAGRSPLFWAAAKGHEDIVRLLLERHANPNFVDKDGQTPLSMAKQNGHDKVIDLLEGA
jgi:ankyrin repeat protein